ncbi:hypothetical protein EN873_01340 [bacterium M00.F.Ca.ET.230.01.1.1]|nr:hypothetical protein EN873_01340 [bacterium M00.F.Ca.ET.230.01.1.1]
MCAPAKQCACVGPEAGTGACRLKASAAGSLSAFALPSSPSGHFCPYSDGGKGLAAALAPLLQRRRLAKPPAEAPFSPFTGRRWRQPDEGRR